MQLSTMAYFRRSLCQRLLGLSSDLNKIRATWSNIDGIQKAKGEYASVESDKGGTGATSCAHGFIYNIGEDGYVVNVVLKSRNGGATF